MDRIDRNRVRFIVSGLFVSAHFLRNQIGCVKFVDNGDGTVLLGNVEVYEQVELRESPLDRLLRRFLPTWGVAFPP